MFYRLASFLVCCAVLPGCGPISQTMPRPTGQLPPPNETPYSFDSVARGRIVFDNACVRCHGLDAPADSAPAMHDIALRYRAELVDQAAVVERVAAWIGVPSTDRALLPGTAIEHWGVMRRVALDRDLAVDVGHYVWSLTGIPSDTGRVAGHRACLTAERCGFADVGHPATPSRRPLR